VSKWRKRFANLRVSGLEDQQRSGRRAINDETVERRLLEQLAKAPLVAEALGDVSDDAVWRVLRKHDLHLDQRQSWCVRYRSGVFQEGEPNCWSLFPYTQDDGKTG
jgi:hypothetical protein